MFWQQLVSLASKRASHTDKVLQHQHQLLGDKGDPFELQDERVLVRTELQVVRDFTDHLLGTLAHVANLHDLDYHQLVPILGNLHQARGALVQQHLQYGWRWFSHMYASAQSLSEWPISQKHSGGAVKALYFRQRSVLWGLPQDGRSTATGVATTNRVPTGST